MIEQLVRGLQPRDHGVAARMVATLCTVAASVTIVFAAFEPSDGQNRGAVILATAILGALVVFAAWATRFLRDTHLVTWAVAPLAAITVIAGVDYLTSDATVSAQVFFFFPALYAASQLRRGGAMLVTGAAVLGNVLVVAGMLPWRAALIDSVYVATALVTTSILLVRSGERQEASLAQLRRLAAIDPLTGLVTRRVLDEAARSALSGVISSDGASLILVDVDEFKQVNDRYGHPGGDAVLVQLANLLTDGARFNDVVSRMGGDEMALLMLGCSVSSMRLRADELVRRVGENRFLVGDGEVVSLTVSVGMAHAPTEARDLRSMYVAADLSLYDAKRSGRNRVGATVSH